MHTSEYVSDEALIKAVQAAPKKEEYPYYADWKDVRVLLPDVPDLLGRLRELAHLGRLKMTYGWKDYATKGTAGVNPAVGFNHHEPFFDTL